MTVLASRVWRGLFALGGCFFACVAGPLSAAPPVTFLGSPPVAHAASNDDGDASSYYNKRALLAPLTRAYGDAAYGLSVNPAQRESSRIFYNSIYRASEGVASGWTGNLAVGFAGTTSQAFRDSTVLRINYFRAMAGLPAAVSFSDVYNAKDQQAALMMSANNQLNHTPPASWLYYTAAGAEAASRSNLALGSVGSRSIDAYIQDYGANNDAAGHRRWILYPATSLMGSGDADVPADSALYSANALWVVDDAALLAPRPATRESFVAWPPPGFVPYQLVFRRWSLAYAGADFSQATVSMQRGGQSVPVRLESLHSGYGENTLVWVPDNLDANEYNPLLTAPNGDVTTTVTVSNVRVGGVPQTFSYQVTAFNPLVPGPEQVLPVVSGAAQISTGAPAAFSFNAVPAATGYAWQSGQLTASTLMEDAERGLEDMEASPASARAIATTEAANGAACYHLSSAPDTVLRLKPVLVPGAGATIQFNSRLGYATSSETARVQVSTDDGFSWRDVYYQTGPADNVPRPETAFTSKTISLTPFAGQVCQVRFTFERGNGYYYGPGDTTGWFVDDILVSGTRQIALAEPVAVAAGQSFSFTPAADGSYGLRVLPYFYGKYQTETGPLLVVAAGSPASAQPPEITSALTVDVAGNQFFSYQIVATNSPTAFEARGLPAGVSVNAATGLISGVPTVNGVYGIYLIAYNAQGGVVRYLLLTVGSGSPSITSGASASMQPGVPFSYQITATNAPTNYAAAGLPPGLSVNAQTGLISGTPTTRGVYAVALSAMNARGIGTGTLSLTVSGALVLPPTITSAPTLSGQVGVGFRYQIDASNLPTSYTTSGLPPGLSLDTGSGVIAGTPTAMGAYRMSFSAFNAAGTGAGALTLTILPLAPVIAGETVASGQTGVPFNYAIVAMNDATRFDAAGLPPGLSVDEATGFISGTPTQAGDFTVTLKASNEGGEGAAEMALRIDLSLPTVKLTATVPMVMMGSGGQGEFTLTRDSEDVSQELVVYYEVKGSAVGGADYQKLKGFKKMKAGKRSVRLMIVPLGTPGDGTLKRAVKVTLQPSDGYKLGDAVMAKVKIFR
jgi:uncharacterized protein YkwD